MLEESQQLSMNDYEIPRCQRNPRETSLQSGNQSFRQLSVEFLGSLSVPYLARIKIGLNLLYSLESGSIGASAVEWRPSTWSVSRLTGLRRRPIVNAVANAR